MPCRRLRSFRICEDRYGRWEVRPLADERRRYYGSGDYNERDTAFIVEFQVKPEGKGLGARMLQELEAHWKRKGIRRISLEPLGGSESFWKAMGFKRTGTSWTGESVWDKTIRGSR